MTIQELINRLEELSDKELQVKIRITTTNKFYRIYECYGGFNAAYITVEGEF